MSEDFYPFVDSGDPAPDNAHLTGDSPRAPQGDGAQGSQASYATRISVYDDMLSTPRVIVIEQNEVRTYLEEITNTAYRTMREQGGRLPLMVIRELVENFIHARFIEPVISILDDGNTIRFADQGPGIEDKERAFEYGVTSADREQKRYIRGTGSGLPMVQEYLENAGGALSIEDNLNQGTVVTVSIDPERVLEINRTVSRGAAVRGTVDSGNIALGTTGYQGVQGAGMASPMPTGAPMPLGSPLQAAAPMRAPGQMPLPTQAPNPYYANGMPGYPQPLQPTGYPGYQQPGHEFSTIPQYHAQAGTFPAPMPLGTAGATAPASLPDISERGLLALQFLLENGACGPTDLTAAYGESTPTWSRELGKLSTAGLVRKHGQKRVLTDMGRAWIQQQH